jgi:hypothetical protein
MTSEAAEERVQEPSRSFLSGGTKTAVKGNGAVYRDGKTRKPDFDV